MINKFKGIPNKFKTTATDVRPFKTEPDPILPHLHELAARSGSINTFDRRGTVVWMDDFEGLLKWNTLLQGTGASVIRTNAKAYNGSFSTKATPGSSANDYAYLLKEFQLPKLNRIGIETSFLIPADVGAQMIIYVNLYNGTTKHAPGILYDIDDEKLYYKNSINVWTEFATDLFLTPSLTLWHTLKFVVDLDTNKYVRCICNNVEYNLSSYAFRTVGSATNPKINIWIGAVNAGAVRTLYFDNFILTQNEP